MLWSMLCFLLNALLTLLLTPQHLSCIGRGFYDKQCSGNGNPCNSCTGVRDIDFMKRKVSASSLLVRSSSYNDAQHLRLLSILQNKSPSTYTWANANCNGSVHCLGYVYAEAVWSLYKRHLQQSPYNYEDNTALEIVMRLTYLAAGNVQTWFSGSPPFGGCGASSGYLSLIHI